MKKSDQNIFLRSIKSWQFLLLVLLFAFTADAFALQQLYNENFTGSLASWTTDSPVSRPNALSQWDYDGANGNPAGSFNGGYFPASGGDTWGDAILQQIVRTPDDPVIAVMSCDRFIYRTNNIASFSVYGRLQDNDAPGYPAEPAAVTFLAIQSSGNFNIPNNVWASSGLSSQVTLTPGKNYAFRFYMQVSTRNGRSAGARIDNCYLNFSPSGLRASLSGGTNNLSWTISTGSAILHGTNPYRVYRSVNSGVYGAAIANSTTNSYSDAAPPAAAVVFYRLDDVDTNSVVSPPSPELPVIRTSVNDGVGADIDYTSNSSAIAMNWTNVANVGGMTKLRYEVALGTTAGGFDVVGWTDVGGATNYNFTGLSLVNGTKYYTSVRIVTAAHGNLNACSSDGISYVTTAVRDGAGADVTFTNSLTDVTLNWDAIPGGLPLLRYEVALGTTVGGTEVCGWTNVGVSTSHTFSGLGLTNGNVYYCSVRPVDTSAVVMGTFTSDGFSPAVSYSTTVRDGSGADVDVSLSASSINLNWDNVVMTKVRYEAALGTAPGGTNIVNWTDMALATSGSLSGFTLVNGTTYYCSVRIVLGAGPLPADSSDGFTYNAFEVRDGTGVDEDFSYLPSTVNANWSAVSVPINRYEVALGTTFGGTDVVGWTNAGMATSWSFTSLGLVNHQFYYTSVRVYDSGGALIGSVSSNGFETILPTSITVRDGLGPDIAASFFENRVEANWDHPDVSLYRYEVGVGTGMYTDNIYPFTDVGQAKQASITGLSLASGTPYYVSVKGINTYKELEALGCTNGFVARRDPVLIDTASQSYFHNARVLNMMDTTSDPGSIRPKVFSGGAGAGYWRFSMPVTVVENGITDRVNAPCRVAFTIPVAAQRPAAVGEFRVADDQGNELPRYNLPAGTVAAPDLVFLVNMKMGETRTYYVYWGNTGVTTVEANYGFSLNSDDISIRKWTPYYSRKNLPAGIEEVPQAYKFTFTGGLAGDDQISADFNLNWPFYFYNELQQNGWNISINGALAIAGSTDYSNTWGEFIGSTARWTRLIAPLWIDLRIAPSPPAPAGAGIFRDYLTGPDRVAFTWITNRYTNTDDIYTFQTVLYRSGDIANRYSYLSPLGLDRAAGGTDQPVNSSINHTVGISYPDDTGVTAANRRWLINTPLRVGTNKSPTAFYQYMDAMTVTPGAISGGAVGTWVTVSHIESMVFDSRSTKPKWQRVEYDCSGDANNRLLISTRTGATPLPDGSWTAWTADTVAVVPTGNIPLTDTNRYIQYRCQFQRNNNAGTLPRLNEVRFFHGGISIEEIKANTPNGVSQGQNGIPVEVTIKNFYSAPVDLQSVELTFSLGNHTQVLTGPAMPTSIAAGDTASVFFTVNVNANSPVGTATVDARATATVTLPVLTFYDGDAQTPHKWWIRTKSQLVIDQVETEESFVNKGQTDLFVRMHVSNTGETPFALTAAGLIFTLGLYNPPTILQSPALGTVIPPLSSFIATFTVNVDPLSPSGVAIIGGTASGTNTFSGALTEDMLAAITDSWTIQNPSELVLEEVVASDTVYRGQTDTPVFLQVSNGGEATARWQSSSIILYLNLGLYDAEYPITPFEILIPGGFEATARYGVDISPISPVGTSIVDASVSGQDFNTGFAISWTNALVPTQWTILAEKINTFKDAAHSQNSISFNRPTAGSLTIYAKAENLNPYGEFVIRWLNPSGTIIAASPPLTADASGTISHQMDITSASPYGNYKIRVTNPINTIISCENQFEVVSPAVLTAAFSMPSQVSVGQPFTASFTFINSGGAVVSSAYVSNPLQFFGPGTALQTSGQPALTDVTGNNQATVTYNFTAQAAGNFSASGTAYGFDANSGKFLTSPAVTSNVCLIQNPPVVETFAISAVPAVVYPNQKNLPITVTIRNTGQATAVLQAASLTFSLGSYVQGIDSPAFPYSLAGGASINLVYNVSVAANSAAGDSDITSNVLWYDQNWPASSTWLTVAPPSRSWKVAAAGIKLSSDEDFNFEQADFNRGQRMYIRAYGVAPLSGPYRIRVYGPPVIAQTANVPGGFVSVSPLLTADAGGEVDFYYDIGAGATVATWSAVLENDPDSNVGTLQSMLSLQYFRVQYPGSLVASLTISPASVFVGENFTVTMTATNTVAQSSTISNATPSTLVDASAFPNFGGSATLLSGPAPASVTVKSLETRTISYTYRADSDTGLTASYALTVAPAWYAAGKDLNTGAVVYSGKGVSNPLKIYSRRLQMTPDSLDLGSMECGATKKADGAVLNIGNYQLDNIKWITTDLNGPGALKISKSNLSMSPNPVNSLLGGGSKAASATLFIPYNKEAGDYVATMSVYNDRNPNDLADIDEAYDLFNLKVTVASARKIFTVQEKIDLGAWPLGQTSPGTPLNFFSGGNIALTNVKLMQLPGAANGTNTFVISATPSNPGPMAITGVGVASISAVNVAVPGIYIATWTIWDDAANPGVVDAGEASDTFQVRVQVGVMNYALSPFTVDAGSVEPSGLNLGFGLTLTNDAAGLPLTRLKLDNYPLTSGGNTIASDNIAIYTVNNPIPPVVVAGQAIPVDLALFVPAGTAAGAYSAPQYIYHDDNGNNKWDGPAEFRASFVLQATVPAVPKVQVMATTVGLGGIAPGTSKIVSFNCRNTGNVTLTGLRWQKVNLMSGANVIPAANASFPPSELFSVAPGAFFTRQVELSVPGGTPYGLYESIPNHFWIWADMPVNNVRDPGEASWSFKISCEVGNLLVDIDEANLSVTGPPSATTPSTMLSARNTGSLALVNIKATGTALILTPAVAGAVNIAAPANNFSPATLGSANAGQVRTSQWSVTVPANASAGVYLGTATVWEDSNNNGLRDAGEAFSDCPVSLTVLSAPAINVVQTQLDLGWVSRNSSKSGQIEIRNTGNIILNSVNPLKAPLVFGANNIPVASITITTIPAMPFSLGVGQSKIATVTVTIGAVQGAYTYSGIQSIFEDLAPAGWNAGDVSDVFDLIVSVGNKVIYETALSNPPLAFGGRNVNGTYNVPVTVYSGSAVPLDRVTWKVISPFTSPNYTFPVGSLTFTPAQATTQSIAGLGNRAWQATAEVGYAIAGNYIATAAFFDDSIVMNSDIDGNEASATFQITLTVNPVDGIDLLPVEVDFGTIVAGASKTVEVGFRNTGNYDIGIMDLGWTFSDIASLTLPSQVIAFANIDVLSYTLVPVPPGAVASANIRLSIPAGQVKDIYGPSGPQRLTRGASTDTCDFRVVVSGATTDVAMVEPHSLYQVIATATFQPPPPNNLYFLSAWVCPGSGSADIGFVQYNVAGLPLATLSVRVDELGNLTANGDQVATFTMQYSGISDQVPIEIEGQNYNYYRVYLAFNLTYNELNASSTRLILHNSSSVIDRSVWFDGIKLERAFEGQTRPTTYHPGATIHSPSRQESLQGGHQYYEW
ncbi:MAG TPA: hypothetical protein PLM07_06425 [Candidatus Rifleibacterium sp.]|nr:hypothetical protein [Candidatus Rifleibacterium sp.]